MNPETLSSWQVWAVLSAVFAALTAIFAKVGVEGINSDLATLIRKKVIVLDHAVADFVCDRIGCPARVRSRRKAGFFWCSPRHRHRRIVALLLSRLETRPGDAGRAHR